MRYIKFIIVSFFLLNVGMANSQNLQYYATNPNGIMGEKLFPEDENGDVCFSDIIEEPYSIDSIMSVVPSSIPIRAPLIWNQ